jgi:hypothetical protein
MLIMNNKKGDTPIVSKKPSFAEKLTAGTPENLTSMAEGDGEGEEDSDAMQAAADFFTAIEQKDKQALIDAFRALDMATSSMEEEGEEGEEGDDEGEAPPKSSGKDPKALMAILMAKRKP